MKMTKITEDAVEIVAIELLEEQGYSYTYGPTIAPDGENPERDSYSEVVLKDRFKRAVYNLNSSIPDDAKEQALRQVLNLPSQNLIENNEAFHKMLTDGIEVEFMTDDGVRGDKVWLIDFDNPNNNDFVVCNQFTVIVNNTNKRPDIVLFVNGLPLVVIELKNPNDENATVKKAYTQLQNYKSAVPSLFNYNTVLVSSDGLDAKAGSLTAGWSRFMAWKSIDGSTESAFNIPQIEVLIKGMLKPEILLDLVKHFTVFEKDKKEDANTGLTTVETVKKIASYHQFYAVRKAVESTLAAVGKELKTKEPDAPYLLAAEERESFGSGKIGVIWHTQGSGKSLSMVFYTGKIILVLDNPTVIVITDRNDLDDQLFETFAGSKQLLRQEPTQAQDREDLKNKLKVAGGGIVFTTIQKFFPEDGSQTYDLLSNRKNIVVIADEAHRSHYGFKAKTRQKDNEAITSFGFAKYIRDALPNASFIGFTGTPVEKEDASTPAVFGNYIDIYDIEQAIEDGATVPIYYESRLVKVQLKKEDIEKIDDELDSITEKEEEYATEKAKAKWTQLEAIVGDPDRIQTVAEDLLEHFEKRQQVFLFQGKAMIVTMSRRIAVDLYNEIIKLRPNWHSNDKDKGKIKIVMTASSSDPESWQQFKTTKKERKQFAERFKDTDDELQLVIVRDMWLTGFDVPCLHTMYVDKPMRGHSLMQAIARVNRVFKDKPGGLIVDYLGIATELKTALSNYTQSGGKGTPTLNQEEAVVLMLEQFEVVNQMFDLTAQRDSAQAGGFDYQIYFNADTRLKLQIILEAQEHILSLEDGKNRFNRNVDKLSKAFALSVPDDRAMDIKDEVGFFQAVKARLVKFTPTSGGRTDEQIDSAIRQIVSEAIVTDGVIDVFGAAGIKKPDISILSDEFMKEVKGMERKNLAVELLKKLLNDEIKTRMKKNHIQSKKLSEMLDNAIKRYISNQITTVEVIDELIKLAKEIKEADARGEAFGLTSDESAFYDSLADNKSARDILGDDQLRDIARILVEKVKKNTTIDWTIKESVRAKLRVLVKRTLRKYGYPPDLQKIATENILKQAELLAEEWAKTGT